MRSVPRGRDVEARGVEFSFRVNFLGFAGSFGCVLRPMAACLNKLKGDLRTLESLFPANHERFQVSECTVDEITCSFIGPNGQKIRITANIMVRSTEFPFLGISLIFPF